MAVEKPFSDLDPVRFFPEKGYRGQAAEQKGCGEAVAPPGGLQSLRVPSARAVILHSDAGAGAAHGRLLELTADTSQVPADWQTPQRIQVEYRPYLCPGTGLTGPRRTLSDGILDRTALARLCPHGAPPRSLALPLGWSLAVVFEDATRTVYRAEQQEVFVDDIGLGDLAYLAVKRSAPWPVELRGAADHAGPALALDKGFAEAAEVAADGIRSIRLRPGTGLLLAAGDPLAGTTRLVSDDIADLEPEWRLARAVLVSCPVVYDASHQAGAWRNLPEGEIHGHHLAELLPEGAPIRRLQAPQDRPLTAYFLDGTRQVVRGGGLDVDPRVDPLERLEVRSCVLLVKAGDQGLPLLPGTWLRPDVDTGAPPVNAARVPPGWKTALYTEDDLGGRAHDLTADAAVSYPVASAEIRAPAAAFSRPGLRGVRRALGVGVHAANRLPERLASLQVPPGTAVVLCRKAGDLGQPVRICLADVPALEPQWQQPAEARVLACPVVFGAEPLAGDTVNLLGGRWTRQRLAARLPAGAGPAGLQLPQGWSAVIESSGEIPAAHGWTKLAPDVVSVVLVAPAELAAIAAGPAVFAGQDQRGEARLLAGCRGEVTDLPPAIRSLRTPPGTLLTLVLGAGESRFSWRHAADAPALEVHATGARLSACPALYSQPDYKGLARCFAGEESTTGPFASARVPAGWMVAATGMQDAADDQGLERFSKDLEADTAKAEVTGVQLMVDVIPVAPTRFVKPGFAGASVGLEPGRHALGEALGSLRVPPGWEVTLHLTEPDDGKAPAASWRLTEDLASLPDAWARPAAATVARLPVLEVEIGNDLRRLGVSCAIGKAERGRLVPPGTRIFTVELFERQRLRVTFADRHTEVLDGPRRVDDPEAAHGPITAIVPEPSGQEGVVIYEQAYHRGPAVALPDGRWHAPALGVGVPSIRSLQVPLGRRVSVRAKGDVYAPALAFVAGTAALDLPLGLDQAVSEPCPVIYRKTGHQGKCRGLDVGAYAPALLTTGGVHSLKVPAGWTVKLAWRNEIPESKDVEITSDTADVENTAGLHHGPPRKWRLLSVVVSRQAPLDVKGGVAWRLDKAATSHHHAYLRAAPGYPRADDETHRLDGQVEGGVRVVKSGLLKELLDLPADGAVVFGLDAHDVFPFGFRGTVVSLFARALPGGGRWRSSVVLSTAAPDFACGWELGLGARVGLRVAGGPDSKTAAWEVKGPEVQPGQWVHLAVAIDPPHLEVPTLRLYVDGERQCAIPQKPSDGSPVPRLWAQDHSGEEGPGHFPGLVLGRSASGPGCPFSGQVARLRILDAALPHASASAELADLAAAELPAGVVLPLRPALSVRPFVDAASDQQHPTRAARPGGGAGLVADAVLGAALDLPGPGAVWSTVRSGTGIASRDGRARAFTFTAWVRPDPATPGGRARLATVGGDDTGWTLDLVTAGKTPVSDHARLTLRVWFEGKAKPELREVESVRRLPTGRWSHLAARVGGGSLALFVDGYKVAEAQPSGLPEPALVRWFEGDVAAAPLRLGGTVRAPFTARLARVQLHARAPDDTEIAELAASTAPAGEQPPEGSLCHLALREHLGPVTRDSAAWGLDGTLAGRFHSAFDNTFGTVLELHPGDQLGVADVVYQLDTVADKVAPFTLAGWYLPKSDQGKLVISQQLVLELGVSPQLILGAAHDLDRPWALWQWHHFAVSYDGRCYRAFIDGEAACEPIVDEALCRPEKAGDADLKIAEPYGRFAHLRAWRRALCSEEVAAARLAELPPAAQGRVPLPAPNAPALHLPLAAVVRVDGRVWLPDVSGHEGHGRALGRARIVDSDLFDHALLLAAGEPGVSLSSLGSRLAATRIRTTVDDLQEISGIGPKLEARLHASGIKAFADLAALGPEDVTRLDQQITTFRGRIERDHWVDQARELQHGFGAVAKLTWCVWVHPEGAPVLHLGARKAALTFTLAPKLAVNIGKKVSTDVTLPAGRWTHLALVAEHGKLRLFVDGGQVKEVSGKSPRLPLGSTPLSVEGTGAARLAHLRLYGRALSAAEIVAARTADLAADQAAELFPLELHLRGGDGAAAAFLDVAQTLEISIGNRGRRAVRLPTQRLAPSTRQPRSLVLRFPPGALEEPDGIRLAGPPAHGQDRSGDWRVRLRRDPDRSDVVELTALHDDTLSPGETTSLRLQGVHFGGDAGRLRVTLEGRLDHPDGTPLVGRRTAWLALRAMPRDQLVNHLDALHDQAESLAEATSKLAAQASKHKLRLVDLDQCAESLDKVMKESVDADLELLRETRPPLDVGVAGAGSVCCDSAPNQLRVVIRNTAPKALDLDLRGGAPPFALHIRPWSAADPWGLATEDDLRQMKVLGTGPGWVAGRDNKPVIERQGDDLVIYLRPTHAKALGGEPVTLDLGGFPCSAHSGTAHLRLRFVGIGPFGREGCFVIPVRRTLQRVLGARHTSIHGDLELVSRPRLRLAHAPPPEEDVPPRPDAEVFLDDERRLLVTGRELRLGPGHRLGTAGGAPPLRIRTGGQVEVSGEVSASAVRVHGSVIADGELAATGVLTARGGIHAEPGWAAESHHDLGDLVPRGLIIMWSGSADKLPPGWHLCDGGHGTPDLRSRFLIAQGPEHPAHKTGGQEKVHLASDEIPSHTHGVTDPGHEHTFLYHALENRNHGDNANSYNFLEMGKEETDHSESAKTGVKVKFGPGDDEHKARKGEGHENRPPYYALCFIMKA